MTSSSNNSSNYDLQKLKAQVAALNKVQAVIEFDLDGNIITANDNFLSTMGYSLDEIVGQHHSMFAADGYADTQEYKDFWVKLNQGDFDTGEYKRIGKNGREVWIQASYNPILDTDGEPVGVIKFATDITEQKIQQADFQGQISAIGKSQAVIEFNLDGTILTANNNFLATVGYTLDEIVGKHHSMFAEPEYAKSSEYKAFWQSLSEGKYDAGEYKRLGKHGKEIWIHASYNPILDYNGNPYKVVKYATDITADKLQQANYSGQIQAISKSQAVIEFNLDGTIINANENFLITLGYSLDEIKGQHHSMFAEPQYAQSAEYNAFWAKLGQGEYDTGEYKRIGKGGKEIWIQASYNPILDLNGKPYKVVKYATDITARKQAIAEIKRSIIALSNGDLTTRIENDLGKEFGVLGDAMNDLQDDLNVMISEIRAASDNVFDASSKLTEGSNELSKRTESQAASLEETASAMEELTSTVNQNATSAQEATKLSTNAMNKASAGGDVVNNAIGAMDAIEKSSKKISDIISVIDEIAFQTNLLALNAAVEAARAGEQGRGFAVVASEVRNLAQRSASAAKEIKGLISESVEAVNQGSKLVDNTGQTFSQLVEAVKDVVTIISDISTASTEQATGISEVSKTISQMDAMTQQNSSLVEQTTSSSQAMEEQAKGLQEQVASFTIKSQDTNLSKRPKTLRQVV